MGNNTADRVTIFSIIQILPKVNSHGKNCKNSLFLSKIPIETDRGGILSAYLFSVLSNIDTSFAREFGRNKSPVAKAGPSWLFLWLSTPSTANSLRRSKGFFAVLFTLLMGFELYRIAVPIGGGVVLTALLQLPCLPGEIRRIQSKQ